MDPADVVLRPVAQRYRLEADGADGGLIIHVPFSAEGRRFSVEQGSDLLEYRSNGHEYVSAPDGDVVGVEPRNRS